MSSILYYSNYCNNCKTLLQTVCKSSKKKDTYFICIDKRIQKNNKTYIVLESGQEIILPTGITKVPALMLLNDGQRVVFGSSIQEHLQPDLFTSPKEILTDPNIEPQCFSLGGSLSNVNSDQYSFLDMGSTELEAKGTGGVRQMHNYVSLENHSNNIQTPSEDYAQSTIGNDGNDNIEHLMKQREAELR